jgi:hypothetical protein
MNEPRSAAEEGRASRSVGGEARKGRLSLGMTTEGKRPKRPERLIVPIIIREERLIGAAALGDSRRPHAQG